MKRILLFSVLLILSIVTGLNVRSQEYGELTSCLTRWGKVMDIYTEKIGGTDNLEKLSAQCIELADSVSVYTPCLKAVKEKFPDINPDNSPETVKEVLIKFEESTGRFSEMLSSLMQIANKNPDNENFQSAFGKLNLAIYNSRR